VLRSRSASRLGYGKPATLEIREGGVLARSLTVKFAETRTASLRPKSPHPVPLPPGAEDSSQLSLFFQLFQRQCDRDDPIEAATDGD